MFDGKSLGSAGLREPHTFFFGLTRAMRHEIIQHNKFCLNKDLCIENQVQEE